jgi:hypothetical protein
MMKNKKSNDLYWDKILQAWPDIIMAYQAHEDKKPIIEYLIPDRKIYAYPAIEYIDDLTLRTREDARKTYQQACLENKIMIFVRDMENNILRSYVTSIQTEW